MKSLVDKAMKKLNIAVSMIVATATISLGAAGYVFAADTASFTQTINAGTLNVDIVNGGYSTVGSPIVSMSALAFDFECQISTGTFGTAGEQIYIKNPDVADSGWTVSLAASATTAVWDSVGTDFDFNDPTDDGCGDGGGDLDTVGGQMTVDASAAVLAVGQCATCGTANVSLGNSAAFSEGVTDSITLVSGAAGSDDVGDWTVQGISVSQDVPAEQPAGNDYDINMVLSIVAA